MRASSTRPNFIKKMLIVVALVVSADLNKPDDLFFWPIGRWPFGKRLSQISVRNLKFPKTKFNNAAK